MARKKVDIEEDIQPFYDLSKPLLGHEKPLKLFRQSLSSPRCHHAWLLEGPRGIGKAKTAFHMAALAMGGHCNEVNGRQFSPGCLTARAIGYASHTDFNYLSVATAPTTGGTQISVEGAREILGAQVLKSANVKRRILIVDSVDEMNVSSLNALLKPLEEPRANGMVFVVSHGETGLLPTIRSRCVTLSFRPLEETDIAAIFESTGIQFNDRNLAVISKASGGSPGKAIEWSEAKISKALIELDGFLQARKTGLTATALHSVVKLVGATDHQSFRACASLLLAYIADHSREVALNHQHEIWSALYQHILNEMESALKLNSDYTVALGAYLVTYMQTRQRMQRIAS